MPIFSVSASLPGASARDVETKVTIPIEDELRGDPIVTWRGSYRTGEGQIVDGLETVTLEHEAVSVGSYPRFGPEGPQVEVVLKSLVLSR